MRTKTWAPVATFVAVAAIAGAAALLHDGGGSSGPRPLKLAAGSGDTAARSAVAGGGDYVLDITLPTDKPADQRAYDLAKGPADEAVVARLAKALGQGTPKRDGSGWQAGGLRVSGQPGQAWVFSPCDSGPDSAVSSDGAVVCGIATEPGSGSGSSGSGVAVAPPVPVVSGSPVPEYSPPPDVPASVVREGAREVFAALGLDADDATIQNGPYGGQALIEAGKQDGLRVSGRTTGVTVDQTGKVNGGSGFLGAATPGDSYPVVSAKDAFDALPMMAHPDICQLPTDGSQGCVQPEPTHITGAELGLSLQYLTDGGAALVPSWLFATKTGYFAAVAVEQQYRASDEPTDKPVDLPASTDPGGPTQVEPAPPPAKPLPSPAAT